MGFRLKVGVVGLGRRWRAHYRPALHALRDRFRVRAVCDPKFRRAREEARVLGCAAFAGPVALFESQPLDAVLLLDTGWHRLWPLEAACRFGRPVFCARPLEADEARAEQIVAEADATGLPVLMASGPWLTAADGRLREMLDAELGRARSVVGRIRRAAHPPAQAAGAPGAVLPSTGILAWCARILGGTPAWVAASGSGSLSSLWMDCGQGGVAHLLCRPGGDCSAGRTLFEVMSERGWAVVEGPERLRAGAAGTSSAWLSRPRQPAAHARLEYFHRALGADRALQPSLSDAARALGWLRAARRSLREGVRVSVGT